MRFSGTWVFNLLSTFHPEPMVEIPVEPELASSEAEPEPEPEPEETPEVLNNQLWIFTDYHLSLTFRV